MEIAEENGWEQYLILDFQTTWNYPQSNIQAILADPPSSSSMPMQTAKKQLVVMKEKKLELKELTLQNNNYLSQESFGSGSHGQCYRASNRVIDIVVNEMIHKKRE